MYQERKEIVSNHNVAFTAQSRIAHEEKRQEQHAEHGAHDEYPRHVPDSMNRNVSRYKPPQQITNVEKDKGEGYVKIVVESVVVLTFVAAL